MTTILHKPYNGPTYTQRDHFASYLDKPLRYYTSVERNVVPGTVRIINSTLCAAELVDKHLFRKSRIDWWPVTHSNLPVTHSNLPVVPAKAAKKPRK